MMADRRAPGPLESAVISVVAGALAPVAVAEVQKMLPGEPAYTTVMTTLSRLAEKGALTQSREGRAFKYALAVPREAVEDAVAARRMRRLLSDGSDRAGVLARFVAELDSEEERLLADLLDRADHRAGSAR
jgi:predicted transcriptional regulator